MLRSASDKKVWIGARINDIPNGRFVQKPSALIAASYLSAVLADAPKILWKCQEASGQLADSSGNGFASTGIGGTPTYQNAGPFGTDYSVGLNSAYFSRAGISTVTNNFTYEFWFYPITAGGFDAVILGTSPRATSGSNPGAGNGHELAWSASGQKIHAGYAGVADLGDSSAISANAWIHFVSVRDAGVTKYYLNGVAETPASSTSAPIAAVGGVTRIGAATSAPTPGSFRCAYFAFYETALSAARIAAHAASVAP